MSEELLRNNKNNMTKLFVSINNCRNFPARSNHWKKPYSNDKW
jgi:hypothetical protein